MISLAIRWTEEWAIGEERIDAQHRELFARVDALMEAVGNHAREALVADTIAFLEVYVLRHFHDEEKIMREAGYPAIDVHLGQHAAFLEAFGQIKMKYAQHGVTPNLTADITHRVCAWLLNHVGKTDRAFGRFLKSSKG